MKEKKTYEQPRSEVVELRVTNQLLVESGGLTTPEDYIPGGDPLGFESRQFDGLLEFGI